MIYCFFSVLAKKFEILRILRINLYCDRNMSKE